MTTSPQKEYVQLLDGRVASMNDGIECKASPNSSFHSVRSTHF